MTLRMFAAAVALLVCSAAGAKVLSQDRPAPTRLAFLDVRKAFDGYRKHKDVNEQLKKKSDDFAKDLKRAAGQVDDLANRLNTLNSGTPEYTDIEKQIGVMKATIDIEKKYKLRELESEQRKKNAAIYKELCDEAQSYGAEKGLAAVLLYLPPDADMEQNFDMIVLTRTVLCRDDQLDVTDEIVGRLNAQLPPPAAPPKGQPAPGGPNTQPSTPDAGSPEGDKTPPK